MRVKATNTVDGVCNTNTCSAVCGANSHVCMTRSINANSNMARCHARPDTSMVLSVNGDSNIARPDANVHPASINVDTTMRHFDSSVTNSKAAQQCLQQQQQDS
jgi:hypothetical protein